MRSYNVDSKTEAESKLITGVFGEGNNSLKSKQIPFFFSEYLYKRNNIIYQCKINENNNVKCTNQHPKYEHPYEFMAYTIVELI